MHMTIVAIVLTLLGIVVFVATVIAVILYKRTMAQKQEIRELQSLVKSQQVKFGKSFEHFVPFTKDFPGNRENTVFLGMPLDFIAFEEDCIKFIEVKTGQSQLSSKQKHIKQLIEAKNVEFHELRF